MRSCALNNDFTTFLREEFDSVPYDLSQSATPFAICTNLIFLKLLISTTVNRSDSFLGVCSHRMLGESPFGSISVRHGADQKTSESLGTLEKFSVV
jgi:hypothetical protein